jgi:subtilase family serine protease
MTRRTLFLAVPAVLAFATAAFAPTASAAPSPVGLAHRNVPLCSAPVSGDGACDAIRHDSLTAAGRVIPNATPSGYGPADLQSAYNLPSATSATWKTAGVGQVVAIVDAYNDPSALSDVNTYRSQFGIAPLSTCTSASPALSASQPCFSKVNQSGDTRYPKSNGGWAQEISLDLDMVSAVCPNCSVLLVEATSPTFTNLGAAVNQAAILGATEISNSYGGGESSSDASYDASYFNHPGVAITVSSGDSGYGVQYPAASQYVTAVGGTKLTRSSSTRGWGETAWSGAGSGCSRYDAQPSWQSSMTNITGVCARRAVADVSAVADPNTGVAVYDSYTYQGVGGWLVFGGTSVSSPLIASVYALAGNASATSYGSYPYSNTAALNDVTGGSNGSCGNVLCNATSGWDGPTGLGTPNGSGAF